ncbi:MAG: CHRD domain-containing protein [Deltaproteobacteria bacterium]|nr:CHRD domain-containing protein [Deltaproteobacteria bacterium]
MLSAALRSRLRRSIQVAAIAIVIAGPAAAVVVPLSAAMNGAQANAGGGTGSPGTGSATITFDTGTNMLTWSVTWSGLLGTPTLMHFHGPALPNQNAGAQVGIGVAGPPVVGNAALSAGQAADLLAGLWYLNLHTTAFAGGEIRGQVLSVPEPTTLALVGGGLFLLAVRRRRQHL